METTTLTVPHQTVVSYEARIREKRKSIDVAPVSDTDTPRIWPDTYTRSIQFLFFIFYFLKYKIPGHDLDTAS